MLDTKENRELVKSKFPDIEEQYLKVTSPRTWIYNCIAYAADDETKWWWPGLNLSYWPEGVPANETIDAFVKAYNTKGYEVCEDGRLESGYKKIVIFTKNNIPTHAAKQLASGLWASKLGPAFDIIHDLDGMEGDEYGKATQFMKKKIIKNV